MRNVATPLQVRSLSNSRRLLRLWAPHSSNLDESAGSFRMTYDVTGFGGFLAKPEGDGPLPAIVALHGCSGLPEAVVQGASERAVSRGYVILLVDSFTTRAIDHTCTPERYALADIFTRTLDAYGALLFLARQPFVDAHRVAVAGASQGGMVALSAAEAHSIEQFVNPD